jgi:hypothetical protein
MSQQPFPLQVQFAVYGALAGGNENMSQAIDVRIPLQAALEQSVPPGIVNINNTTMGTDPSQDNGKHFAAIVALDTVNQFYACAENQTIDFFHVIPPSGQDS